MSIARRQRTHRQRKSKKKSSLGPYIFRVKNMIHPELAISRKAVAALDSMLWNVCERIAAQASAHRHAKLVQQILEEIRPELPSDLAQMISEFTYTRALTYQDIEAGMNDVISDDFPHYLSQMAWSWGMRSLLKYNHTK